MKIKSIFLAIVFLSSFSLSAFSQIQTFPPFEKPKKHSTAPDLDYGGARIVLPDFFKVGDVTGSIGGAKGVTLNKPVYPEEARAAGAEGKVRVAVEIDETGTVTSAKAVSGNPLLFEAAQKAALQSKFLTPKAGDERTKVSGFLSYNFMIEKPNWFAAVFGLFHNDFGVTPAVTRKAFQSDWTEENELIVRLQEIFIKEPKPAPPKLEVLSVQSSVGRTSASQSGAVRVIAPQMPNREGIAISQKLIELIQRQLANDPAALWQFELNFDLAQASNFAVRSFQRPEALLILRQRLQTAPPGVPPAMLAELQKLIAVVEKAQNKKPNQSFDSVDVSREFNIAIGKLAGIN